MSLLILEESFYQLSVLLYLLPCILTLVFLIFHYLLQTSLYAHTRSIKKEIIYLQNILLFCQVYIIKMILILQYLLLWLVASVEFHLDKQLQLCCMNNIKAITPLSNGAITIEAITPSVTILNGATFTNKVAQIQTDDTISKVVITPDGGVFFGNGSKIIRKVTQNHTNVIFSQTLLWSNMVLTDKYALIGQFKNTYTILKKIDLQNLQIETLTYTPREASTYYMTFLEDLKNGQIILAKGYTISLLNNQTLQVEQQLGDAQMVQGDDFTGIDSYWTDQDSVILIQKGLSSYATYRYSFATKQFQPFNTFYTLTDPLTLTSPNTAVSIWKGNLLYWQDFDKQITAQSWDPSDYIGLSWSKIAVSNTIVSGSPNTFAMVNQDKSQIRYALLGANNQIITIFTTQITEGIVLQAQFDTLDQYLIFTLQNNITLLNELYKLDLITRQKAKMIDGDQPTNVLTFLIMGDYRLIVFVNRTIGNQTTNYIQLRDIATFSLYSQLQVQFNAALYKYKLLADGTLWNFNFLLLVQSQNDSTDSSTALLFKYISSNESIQLLSSQRRILAFEYTFACDKYLINVMIYSSIQVYYGQNLTLVTTIPNRYQYDTFFSQQHLLIGQHSSGSGTSVFDFSKDITNFEQGFFFRQYFIGFYDVYIKAIFPNNGLYLICNTDILSGANYPNILVYDLNKIPIKRWLKLPVNYVSNALIMPSITNSSCIWTFMVFDTTLMKHNDCDLSNPQIVNFTQILSPRLFISKNQKYLLLVYYKGSSYYNYIVQIRLIENIKILIKRLVISGYYQNFQSIDITEDFKIIFHLYDHILVFDMEQQENIDNFDLQSIDLFDASNDIVAFVGKTLSDPNTSILFAKNISNPEILFQQILIPPPKIVKVLQQPTKGIQIAVYDSNSMIFVFVVGSQSVFQMQLKEVVDLKFIDYDHILLYYPTNVSILTLRYFQKGINHQINLNFTKIVPNSNATLFAALVSPTNVKVIDSSMNEVANFIAPANSNIVDVGFSSTDEIYGVTSNGTLFILSPTPCPATFVNVDSVCLCPQNTTNTGGVCQCNPRFTLQGNECICQLVYIDNECSCPNDLAYVNGQCIECSFMCSSCDGTGTFDCTQYSSVFIIGIVGIAIIAAALIVIIVCFVKRRREKVSAIETNLTENKDGLSKEQSSLSEKLNGQQQSK